MKKFLFGLVVITFLMVGVAIAEDKTLTFAWDEPVDLAYIDDWKIFISETAGGPYTEIAVVPNGGTFQAPATMDIVGAPNSTETRYFVMIACGVLVANVGGYVCSANSNEVSYDFEIPPDAFSVPVNFRILPE